MTSEVFVSAGVIGASDDIGFLERLPSAHAQQRDSDRRGRQMTDRRMGAFVSEHKIGNAEIHVREEYGLGDCHRIYVMTGPERVRDTADLTEFAGLAFA